MKLRSGRDPDVALSIDGISCRNHVGGLAARFQTDANFLLMAALGIRSGGTNCRGPLDVDLVRSALRHGADPNLEGYFHSRAISLAACRTMEGIPLPYYNATNVARAEEIVGILLEAGAVIEGQAMVACVKSSHRMIMTLLRAGARADMDDVYRMRDASRDVETARGMFLRRVHRAGGFEAYKEARYETMKTVRLLARDRRVPKEVATYLLGFWASRTLYSHDGAERDSFLEEQRAWDEAAGDPWPDSDLDHGDY